MQTEDGGIWRSEKIKILGTRQQITQVLNLNNKIAT